uniref:Putative glucosyl/glucuronosyl transferase n=1 Tax=Corethrella appendiculata TaxID=1370023 RepID=U5EXT1_9DIPT
MILLKFLLSIVILNGVYSSKILILIPFPGPSHWVMVKEIIKELISRNHEVTAITNIKFGETLKNYTEIYVDPPYPIREKYPVEEMFKAKYGSEISSLFMLWGMGLDTSEYSLKNRAVQQLIERDDLHFDLVLSEQFYQESWLMFAHKYKAPIVTLSTIGYADFMDSMMGLQTPWSHVPHFLLNYEDNMNFCERVYNTYISIFDRIFRKWYYLPKHDEIAQKYFASVVKKNGPLPTVAELEKSISVILVNSHRSMLKPRPTIDGLVNIAGATIRPPKKLPQDLQLFLDNAPDGVIYFSLGAYMQSSLMPTDKVNHILKVFSKLKQKVLWKWENDKIPNLPQNVMVRKWLPQSDILAHKNIILFINHGGMFGTFEAIANGIPTLTIPFYGDQQKNALKQEQNGCGLQLNFKDITEESLSTKLNQLLGNKSYFDHAKERSKLFLDNPIHPMDEAMYWIEYVIRHKGAKHLKSAAVGMPLYQFLLLDVFGVVFGVIFVIFYLLWKILRCVFSSKSTTSHSKKRN